MKKYAVFFGHGFLLFVALLSSFFISFYGFGYKRFETSFHSLAFSIRFMEYISVVIIFTSIGVTIYLTNYFKNKDIEIVKGLYLSFINYIILIFILLYFFYF
jgi:uncharacterized membrane protein YidH (DUF202 family)